MTGNQSMPERISRVCIKWQSQSEAPFFAEFLLRFRYKADDRIETIGVGVEKRTITLWYSPHFLNEVMAENEVEGVLMHEILHVLHKFKARLGGRDHSIFNVAQDACINEIVESTHINSRELRLPKEGVRMEQIEEMGYDGDTITEPVYDFLYEKSDKYTISMVGAGGQCPQCGGSGQVSDGNGQSGESSEQGEGQGEDEGQSGEGSGQGEGQNEGEDQSSGQSNGGTKTCPNCGGSGNNPNDGGKEKGKKQLNTIDNHGKQGQVGELDKQVIDEIINNAKSRSWGSVSGAMKSHVKELIKTKKIPWREKLNKLMAKYVHEPGNVYENTWSKRNRRGLPLPGLRKKSKNIVITVDTSGSVADDDLAKFFGQIEKIIKDYSKVTLIQWDTEINSVKQYEKGDWKKIDINGRGGTIIQPVFDYVKKNLPKTSAIVNFTDGYFSWDIDTYGIDTIWALVNNEETAPIGKTVLVQDSDDEQRR